MVVHWLGGGLDHVYVAAADVLLDLHEDLAVREGLNVDLGQRDAERL